MFSDLFKFNILVNVIFILQNIKSQYLILHISFRLSLYKKSLTMVKVNLGGSCGPFFENLDPLGCPSDVLSSMHPPMIKFLIL